MLCLSKRWVLSGSIIGALAIYMAAAHAQKIFVPRPQQTQDGVTEADMFKIVPARPDDMTQDQAAAKARSLLAGWGLPAPQGEPSGGIGYDVFLQRNRGVGFGPYGRIDYNFSFESRTGELLLFENVRMTQEQLKQVNRQRPPLIRTRQQAQQALWHYARIVGLPENAIMTEFHWHGDNDPAHSDANKAGGIGCWFTIPLPGGYPVNKWHGGPGMSINVDPLDGQLHGIAQGWHVYPVSTQVSLTANQATALAMPSVKAYAANKRGVNGFLSAGRILPVSGAVLEYVVPNESRLVNGGMITVPKQITYPMTMRLAWVVRFGQSEVWIDAADGRQLGVIEGLFK